MLEVDQSLFEFLKIDVDLAAGLVCLHILWKLLNAFSQLNNINTYH